MKESQRKITRFFKWNWAFGLFLILLFGIPRFILVLQANISGGYSQAFIIFFLMWFTPLIFLTRHGRKEIGIKRPKKYISLLYSFIAGTFACIAIFILSHLIYGNSLNNPFVYMANASSIPDNLFGSDKLIFFIIAVIPCMLFSPIGEELLYRGVIHGSFTSKFGEIKASYFDGLAFAITHLAHFGIIYSLGTWTFLPLPSLLWILSMFFVSQVFFRCKQMCDSIYGAILSHAGFNFGMMYLMFYHL